MPTWPDEPLDRQLGHRVTRSAERVLRHLATDLADRGRVASKGAILDVLIKSANIDDLEGEFAVRRP